MLISIAPGGTDDPYFTGMLSLLVTGLVRRNRPEELWIIQIDNWFDHKWLKFSGTGVVDFPYPFGSIGWHGALDEFFQSKVTFPPFTPNRVAGQWSFQRENDSYREVALPKLPHKTGKQGSEANLQRRIEHFSRSAAFVWFSGNTVANNRGSVMVYDLSSDRIGCWFASFHRREEWKLKATKGVSQEYVHELLTPLPG